MRRNRRMIRFSLLLWAGVFAIAIAETIFHALGWIIVTAIIAAGSYQAGTRNMLARTRARTRARRLTANASYGKDARGLAKTRGQFQTRAYRGGSLPREPVETTDAVSAYPPDLPTGMRARLLADPLSGARKLFNNDTQDRRD